MIQPSDQNTDFIKGSSHATFVSGNKYFTNTDAKECPITVCTLMD